MSAGSLDARHWFEKSCVSCPTWSDAAASGWLRRRDLVPPVTVVCEAVVSRTVFVKSPYRISITSFQCVQGWLISFMHGVSIIHNTIHTYIECQPYFMLSTVLAFVKRKQGCLYLAQRSLVHGTCVVHIT